MPNRLDEEALGARRGDCRRPDFVCEVCHFVEQMGRVPTTEKDMWLCYLDRTVTIDEMHKDAKSTSLSNMWAMRAAARWGQEYGVPVMIAGNVAELQDMPACFFALRSYDHVCNE